MTKAVPPSPPAGEGRGEGPAQGLLADVHARVAEAPQRVAIVDGATRLTRAGLLAQAQRLGSALTRRGIGPGAAVAFQLPNWHEACVIHLAALLHGWRLVPLLPMYREAELSFILADSRVQALFLPGRFRNLNHPDLLARVKGHSVPPQNVFIVRGADARHGSWDALLAEVEAQQPPTPAPQEAVKIVLYTSGSTGSPKGVLHTHRSMGALIDFARDFWALSEADVALVPSPVAHIGGAMYAFDFPWRIGMTAVLMDVWQPEAAVALIEREGASFCAGATPFLTDLLRAAREGGSALSSLRRFVCGGASVPPALIEQAQAQFPRCVVSRAYGSTEVPIVCPGIRTRADAWHGAHTDGECVAEFRLLDDADRDVAPGAVGEVVVRAPRMFEGYLRAEDNASAYTRDGYFRMGDLARLVDGRFLEIKGRKKDIIIRLGENISPLEVENVLAEHPAVRQVAIVGIPDARTGEAALAFVVLQPGARFTLEDLRAFLGARGLAKQKFPEHLRIVDALPMNSIGKVLKRELQAWGRSP